MAQDIPLWQRRIDEAVREVKEQLDLNNCRMGNEGMKYLSDTVLKNEEARMKELWLQHNNVGPEGARYLTDGLMVNETVQKLVLSNNYIGDKGTEYLSEGLKVNGTLKELYLGVNNIGNEGMEFLLAAVRVNTSLSTVDVCVGNDYASDEAKQAVKYALVNMAARQAALEECRALETSRMVKSAAKR